MEQSNGLIHKEDLVLLFGKRNFFFKFILLYNDNFLIILRDDTKADLFFHHSEMLNLRFENLSQIQSYHSQFHYPIQTDYFKYYNLKMRIINNDDD